MQILYKTEWSNCNKFRGSREEQAIAWSRQNIIAFSFGKEELVEDSVITENEEYSKYYIYYLHPNYPWELYRLDTGFNFPVERLHFDSSGSQLLGCDTSGRCKIWQASDTLINKFELKKEFNFNCKIVCISWLGLEASLAFDAQSNAKDVADKFSQRIKRFPLTDISGQAIEGIVAVTFLGQIFVVTLENEQQFESLQFSNANINLVDGAVTVTEHGKVSVVVADSEQCVQTFNIVIKKLRGKLSLTLENRPCLVPAKLVDDLSLPFEITKVGFPVPSCSDTVLVCCKNSCGSVVKCFDLCKERISLHPRYQRSVQHLNQLPTVSVWACSKVMSVTPPIETIGMPRLLQSDTTRGIPQFSNLTTIADGNKVARVALPTLVQLDDSNLDLGKPREKIKTICHSPLDLLCGFVTNKGNMGILVLKRFNEFDERVSFRIASNLMEYSLITGVPSWEIAAAASCYSGIFADRCLSCLREDLTDQKSNQEMMFLELLQLEANFYSSMKDNYVTVFECYNALVFKAIRTFIHSVVDSLPAEKDLNLLRRIGNVLEKQSEIQISKIAQSLDCSEATENGKVIAEIHFLLQWIVDYAIHFARLVATKDFKSSFSHLSCFANGTLLELQEMLVLIYIWGQRFPSWQPNVVTLGNPLEVLSQIFRMIVKLQSICNGDNLTMNLEDIPFKSLQLMYLDIPCFDPSGGILSIQQQGQSSPCNIFEFADHDEVNKMTKHAFLGHPLTVGLALNEIKGTLFYDGINCTVLKLLPGETLKQCVQCRLLTLKSCDSGRALNMTWIDRWKRGCICGGHWKSVGT